MERRAFLIWSCSLALPPTAAVLAQAPVSDLESEVYTALLDRAIEDLKQTDLRPVVVAESTLSLKDGMQFSAFADSGKSFVQTIAQDIPEAARAVVEELVRVGEDPGLVRLKMNALRQGLKIHIVSDSRLQDILGDKNRSGNDWQRFKAAYGGAGGVIRFSRVGWDSGSSQALVFTSLACGALCGSGNLTLLERRYGIWRIVKTHRVWVA